MHSRAHILIDQQMKILSADKPWGITVKLLNPNSIFEWVAKIEAFKGSTWEGGVFQVHVKFDENYNIRPPSLYFQTIPFHPNVDITTGRPCIDFLDDWSQWNSNFTISAILITMQTLLSNPVLDSAVNPDAVRMMVDSPRTYLQVLKDCIKASQKVDASLTTIQQTLAPSAEEEVITKEQLNAAVPLIHTVQKKVAKLSFQNYYHTWCMMATSRDKKCKAVMASDYNVDIVWDNKQGTEVTPHPGQITKSSSPSEMITQDSQLARIQQMRKIKMAAEDTKLARIKQMRKIYLQPQNTPQKTAESEQKDEEPLETEVDDLIDWSSKLNDQMI